MSLPQPGIGFRIVRRARQKLGPAIISGLNSLWPISRLNVGGGPNFAGLGWRNLEEVTGPWNPRSFRLSPTCRFPVTDASMSLVYTSHVLEHLEDETVSRILVETKRVLRPGGRMLVKIPDFDLVLSTLAQRDAGFFSNENWGYDSLVWTWRNRGVADCIETRAAMLFCGIWNRDFGNPFEMRETRNRESYHGPPPVDPEALKVLLECQSPHAISQRLRALAAKDHQFNHQNAWSQREFHELAAGHGFRLVSTNSRDVVRAYHWVPDILSMYKISKYYEFELAD